MEINVSHKFYIEKYFVKLFIQGKQFIIMNNKQIAIIIIVVVAALYFIGGATNQNCFSINNCNKCWKTTSVIVQNSSDGLCSKQSCLASSDAQKNNAIVDVLLCACGSTRDADLNQKIESAVKDATGYQIDANTFCSQPGLIISKRIYG